VRDKYGLWWQLVPPLLTELLSGSDRVRAARVMQVMLKMAKLDIAALRDA
jgi:predicted 3-demethylubiquinone-9 3-methyltransferase (glyoxalase superfamily)